MFGITFSGNFNANGFSLPSTLAGASLLVDRTRIPMLIVLPWRLGAELPPQAPAQSCIFQVSFSDGTAGRGSDQYYAGSLGDLCNANTE